MPPQPQDDLNPPISPTTERKQVRRRKKLHPRDRADHNASLEQSGSSFDPSSSAYSPDDQPTSIPLPSNISLPITIVHLFVPHSLSHLSSTEPTTSTITFSHQSQSDSEVLKTTPLFSYLEGIVDPSNPLARSDSNSSLGSPSKGKNRASENHSRVPDSFDQDSGPALSIYESPVKGELVKWYITEGMVLEPEAGWHAKPLLLIKEPCTHAVQWQGQCAICGRDLTISDYTGISETSRASIPMSHGPSTLTVSISEARRLESETRTRLLKDTKLSLIVDLDQTIVHATVDPTVGEWMSDPKNPNWSALQGVGRFQLNDGPNLGNDGCYYYLKMRPGLSEFLHTLAEKYEMHVYTMGTRAYADAVCRIIDPTGELFGGRVLSRDESGSMTQKSLTRLFPVDTSMVVIIDDRGDVWEYSPNLVSVVPYNFFVGIGDINGAFLPPARQLQSSSLDTSSTESPQASKSDASIVSTPKMTLTDPSGSSDTILTSTESETPQPTTLTLSSSADANPNQIPETSIPTTKPAVTDAAPSGSGTSTEASDAQSKLLADQVLGRPLKQKQIELEESHRGQNQKSDQTVRSSVRNDESVVRDPSPSSPVTPTTTDDPLVVSRKKDEQDEPQAEKNPDSGSDSQDTIHKDNAEKTAIDDCSAMGRAVLVDQDTELNRLGLILEDVHTGFYSQDIIEQADVREVISALKQDVLQGVHLAFSSVWPMDAIPDQQDAWKLAEQFGAQCYTKLTPRVTHLVAAKLGTSKVNIALTRRKVSVVKPKWLYDAVTLWRHPNEEEYLWKRQEGDECGPELEIEDDNDGWGAEMKEFDWKDATEEVMAAMEESSEEEEGVKRGRRDEEGDSPLSKRQRLARSRSSKLREVVVGVEEDEDQEQEQEQGEEQGEERERGSIELSKEEDDFLSALAAEVEGEMDDLGDLT